MLNSDTDPGRTIKFDPDDIARAFAHIETKWSSLTQHQPQDDGTLIGLPHPYVVPSDEAEDGFAFREMYYFDTYFIIQGLHRSGREELAEGMLENIGYMSRRMHVIPNANRFYLSSRSQPPFYTSIIFDIYEKNEKSVAWLRQHIQQAEKEYMQVWMGLAQPNIRNVYKNLSRYYDINVLNDLSEAESGWDYTPRFGGKCLSYTPICLNSLLYKYEVDFEKAYRLFEEHDRADVWKEKAAKRAKVINDDLWDEKTGFYFDYNYENNYLSPVWSLAAFYPLWAGLATKKQATSLVSKLHLFTYAGGLSATAEIRDIFDTRSVPKQWAHPNGWAPLHWIVIQGLINYGYKEEAQALARRWLKTNVNYFLKHGVFREAYNVISPLEKPVEGAYPPQLGFAWTNAVFVDLAKQFLDSKELEKV